MTWLFVAAPPRYVSALRYGRRGRLRYLGCGSAALRLCVETGTSLSAWIRLTFQTFPNTRISARVALPKRMNIRSATFQISAPNLASCPVSDLPEFAFIGRSNVGKSSLLNMLVGGKDLARVSATPGHTQLINFFSMNNTWSLVDLPGYGFAKTAKTERDRFQDMIADYLSGRTNLACAFVLIDSRHKPQQIDLDFVQWLKHGPAPFALVFTKTDMMKAGQVKKNIELFEGHMSEWCQELPRVFTSSSKTRSGRPELLEFIEKIVG